MVFKRLPNDIIPLLYHIHLTPNFNDYSFEGSVIIDIDIINSVDNIILNSADLNIKSCELSLNNSSIEPKIILKEDEELLILQCSNKLQIGKAKLNISFTGILNDSMKGFYRSKYTLNGEDRYAAVTQFESTDARRAFPCWDEPAIKAKFSVSITAPSNRVILSNMPEIKCEINSDMKTVVFDETPIMSTYLLAFVIGEFDYIEEKTPDNRITIRVYVPIGKKEQGKFALNIAVKTLPFYEDYFGIKYPLPKADLIAIPDFAAGAMENWGLTTYRETALLVDPNSSSISSKQWVAIVVNHELAHQWFGNYVTMEWWTHLWLNEGFASWMEYFATDNIYPEWKMWKQFVYQAMGTALDLDSLKSSHPIEVPVNDPNEIDEIFDDISYEKGCTIIRMLHSYLGKDAFKEGLHEYLEKHQYSNAFTEDLWQALENTSNKPVKEMMDTWTKQMGYPVVTISVIEDSNKIKIEQNRFLASGNVQGDDAKYQWFIPISIITNNNQNNPIQVLFKEKSMEIEINDLQSLEWLKLNSEQTGFYRVQYNSEILRNKLVNAIESEQLQSATDRLGIQSDALALSRAGIISTIEALELIKGYKNETDYTVWADLSANFGELVNLLKSHINNIELLNSFGISLYEKIGSIIQWESSDNDDIFIIKLRSIVLSQLGKFGHKQTIDEAKKRFNNFINNPSSLSPDLRSCVYSIVMQHGDEDTYNSLLKIMKETDLQEEKGRCRSALGKSSNIELLKRTLNLALSPEIRPQDATSVINSVARNPLGHKLAWEFLKDNWDTIKTMYKGGFLLNSVVKGVVSVFSSKSMINEINTFFSDKSYTSRSLEQSIETIQTNAEWIIRDVKQIEEWLQKQ